MALLQVALDLTILDRATQIAKEAVAGGADWIEVGTPLIKSEGMNAVRTIKKMFPKNMVVADMKTMDVGNAEAEIAAKSGADIVVILGVADDSTIAEGVKAAQKYGSKIMVDLMNVENLEEKIKSVEKLGAEYLCIHVGVDQQMIGMSPVEKLKKIYAITRLPIAVAGGLNSETAPEMIKNGASIIIVGGGIIKAPDVEAETRKIKKSIESLTPIETNLYKKYSKDQIKEALMKVSSSNISDAMHRKGAIGQFISLCPGSKIVGSVLTVKTMDGDWAKPVEAIDRANEGEILFIDVDNGPTAVWGELATWSAHTRKLAGVIVYGAVRDVDAIKELHYPIFAKKLVPNAGEPKGFGEIGIELNIEGKNIKTGDWIMADESGIVVIPKEELIEITNRAVDVFERENRIREEIQRGSTLSAVQKLEEWEKVG
jgi:3-hexulose-6-phosphate synthase/6-phospho-3-hexuloisomerase